MNYINLPIVKRLQLLGIILYLFLSPAGVVSLSGQQSPPGLAPESPPAVSAGRTRKAEHKKAERKYEIADIYMIGADKLAERYIQIYLKENGISIQAKRSKKQLDRAALRLQSIADEDPSLLAIALSYQYQETGTQGPEVYIEVLVSEMSISFIPGGGDSYAKFGWANRIPRKGQPSLIWLAAGYNRQDIRFDFPYLWWGPLGLELQAGHNILDQWDFSPDSRIRSRFFATAETYLQPWSWLKLGLVVDVALLYFLKGGIPDSPEKGLGPELNGKGIPGRWHGSLAILGKFSIERDFLANHGLGYHLAIETRHELAGIYAGNHAVSVIIGMVSEPFPWFRPSFELRGDWQSEGMLPLRSEVFSSKRDGYIRGTAELRLLFQPIHLRNPLAIDLGWNLGAIVGFAHVNQDFSQVDLQRDLELGLFLGPEVYFGMPINVRGQFDFGIIFHKQFQKLDFAFHIRIL